MNLIERYIFWKILGAVTLVSLALGMMVWLSQALREFDLVTVDGQALLTFLEVSVLLLPVLVAVIVPVSAMIAVLYGFAAMNTDSELVIVNAIGARQSTIVKPTLLVGLIVALVVASMTLFVAPAASRSWTRLVTSIRGDIIVNLIHEGAFVRLAPGLTFHTRSRNFDGSLGGVFVSDSRDPKSDNTYLAETGSVIENVLGTFLIMNNGTIQQRSKSDNSISIIQFSSYAFDLSSFSATGSASSVKPNERPTAYLFNPDPDDPYFRDRPGLLKAELTDRLVSPLYCFVLTLIPLLFIGQATSSRQSRNANIATASIVALALRVAPYFLPTETSDFARIAAYAIPLAMIAVITTLILRGVQLKPPEPIVAFFERLFSRISGMVSGRSAATSAA